MSDKIFVEKDFESLKWGMSKESFKQAYPRAEEVVESVPNIMQDLNYPFHGHSGVAGFTFGEGGLQMVSVSYYFEWEGIQFKEADVLAKSKQILEELKRDYGETSFDFPWDRSRLNYMWIKDETLMQFAWDGGSSWGIHFRSIKLDPWARELIDQFG